MSNPESAPVGYSATRNFGPWLQQNNASILASTYQSGLLFFIGVRDDGTLSCVNRPVARCMGLAAAANTFWAGTLFQVWRFENSLAAGQTHDGFDGYFIPRVAWTTGDIDIHDLAIDAAGRPLFVSTAYSCVATVDERYSFRPVWKPSFISRLVPEDRCHLNGLAMVDGTATYATCVSRSDVANGWRDFRDNGGLLLHIPSNEIVASGLSMPHSPRWYRGRLWLHNSGTGEFGWVDLDNGCFVPVAFCPGYLRGLSFINDYAVVGLSLGREGSPGTLPLHATLQSRGAAPRCALQVIEINKGEIQHEFRILGDGVREFYDTAVLPGVRVPGTVSFMGEDLLKHITIAPADSGCNAPSGAQSTSATP